LHYLVDVQELIKIKKLDPQFANRLRSSVRNKHLQLWNGVARAIRETDKQAQG